MGELITETADATFAADVLQSDLPVLVDFCAPWCAPCKTVAPVLERIAAEYHGRLRVMKYNVDEAEDRGARFNIRGIPALLAFRDGVEVARCTGVSALMLRGLIEAVLRGGQPARTGALQGFGGDAARKAECIARLVAAIDAGRLVKPERGAVEAGGGYLPSEHTLSSSGADYSTELGVPAMLAVLHDYFFERAPADGRDTRFALDFVEAIPVGGDLNGVLPAYVQWVLHDPTWGLARSVPSRGGLRALWERIVDHHGQRWTGTASADETWSTLSAQCAALQQSFNPETSAVEMSVCYSLESVIASFRNPNGVALVDLIGKVVNLRAIELEATWWTDAERAALASHQAEAIERVAALVPALETGSEDFNVHMKRAIKLMDSMTADFNMAHPAIAERHQELSERIGQTRIAQQQYLLGLMRAARPARDSR